MRLFADNIKVTLKNGVTITGDLKELVTTDHITLIIGGVESIISMDEVSSIEQMKAVARRQLKETNRLNWFMASIK